MRRLALGTTLTAVLAFAGSASAQSGETLRLSINGGAETARHELTQHYALPLYQENADVTNHLAKASSPLFDAGVFYRMTGHVWAGAAVTTAATTSDGAIAATLPHPLQFNQSRSATAIVDTLKGTEKAVHFSVGLERPLGRKLDVMLSAGPSWFGVAQELITTLEIDEQYPFDTAAITTADRVETTGSAWGFNVGADVSYRLSRTLSVGGLIRLARGSATLDAASGNSVSAEAGGLQAGGGIRLIF